MLKYIRGLVLCLVILYGVAYVSPTYAASANVVLTQIQAGGVGAALEEMVVLYNNSSEEIDISDWCIKNKSNVAFACFNHESTKKVALPGYSFATIASQSLSTTLGFYGFSIIYSPTNQSSGSIVGGGDTITVIDRSGSAVDSHSWSTGLIGGMVFVRQSSPTLPFMYFDTDQLSDWWIESPQFIPDDQTVQRDAVADVCSNIDGTQPELPDGYVIGSDGDCHESLLPLKLTELLPNASGSDTDKEYIEIYNPNEMSIDLAGYELLVGQNLEKSFKFPSGSIISAGAYIAFTNADIPFSLLNSSSRVQLRGGENVFDESPPYQDPADDTAWALIEGMWQYTRALTPGAENRAIETITSEVSSQKETASSLKPCSENQYRSSETNRCRNLDASTVKNPTLCKDGQYRSEETNRCRNIASAAETVSACKEGQERNPETNRCRNIKAMSTVDYGVLGATTSNKNNQTYMWLAIGALLLLALAYAVWEWRFEINKVFQKLIGFVRIRK